MCRRHRRPNGNRHVSRTLRTVRRTGNAGLGGIFRSVDFGASGLNRRGRGGRLLHRLLRSFNGSVLGLDIRHINDLSIVNGTCRFLVGRFTTDDKTATNRFCAPPRMSGLLTAVLRPIRNSRVYSPTYNSKSLLVGYKTVMHGGSGSGGCTLCNRRTVNSA